MNDNVLYQSFIDDALCIHDRQSSAYNEHLPQKGLGHHCPLKALKTWQQSHPHLFKKVVRNHPGPDS